MVKSILKRVQKHFKKDTASTEKTNAAQNQKTATSQSSLKVDSSNTKKEVKSGETYRPGQSGKAQKKPQNQSSGKQPAPKTQPAPETQRKPRPAQKPKPEWDEAEFAVEPEEGKIRFHDLNIDKDIMHAIYDLGFKYCSPIQEQILPEILKGRDAIGKAQTGTGKTAAFLISLYSQLLKTPRIEGRKKNQVRALILAPTRELAMQLEKECQQMAKHTPFTSLAVFGGIDYKKQRDYLQTKYIDVLVATPGRLLDYHRSKVVDLSKVEILVIDEADRMLDMGFIPDVRTIVTSTPFKDKRQTMFFSATFNDAVLRLADQWTKNPFKVEIEPEKVASENIVQKVYLATDQEKFTILYNMLKQEGADKVLVFANRRNTCRRIWEKLKALKFETAMLTGEVDQSKRIKTLQRFKDGDVKVVVATDVAGRGIHVDGVTHVINYDLPEDPEDYVHRIGRTGRAGACGNSVSFASEYDSYMIPDLEKFLGDEIKCSYPAEELLAATPPIPHIPRPPRKPSNQRRNSNSNSNKGRNSRNNTRTSSHKK